MPVLNSEISRIFDEVADLLEIESANPFRVRAYRNAARTISSLPRVLSEMVDSGEDLLQLPGIGKDLAGKIHEIMQTGTLSQLRELEEQTPPGLLQLMRSRPTRTMPRISGSCSSASTRRGADGSRKTM